LSFFLNICEINNFFPAFSMHFFHFRILYFCSLWRSETFFAVSIPKIIKKILHFKLNFKRLCRHSANIEIFAYKMNLNPTSSYLLELRGGILHRRAHCAHYIGQCLRRNIRYYYFFIFYFIFTFLNWFSHREFTSNEILQDFCQYYCNTALS
jgi:hypothetical protein